MAATKSAKQASPSPEETPKRSGRAADTPNENGYACRVCWVVPETIRNDGVSTARHLPGDDSAPRFRGSEYCAGQGTLGRFPIDADWKPGAEPENSITASEHREHGTARFEARQQAREQKAAAAAQKPKKAPAKRKAPAKGGKRASGAKKAS